MGHGTVDDWSPGFPAQQCNERIYNMGHYSIAWVTVTKPI